MTRNGKPHKEMEKLTLSQLESFLWETADILRGNMDLQENLGICL